MGFFDQSTFGALTVDPFDLWWRGEPVRLSGRERLIVLLLVRAAGQVITWRGLALKLGFADFGATEYGNVRCYVARTRSRFRAVDPGFAQLEAVHGEGFRWSV